MEDDELEAALHQGFTRAVTRAEVMPGSYQHFHHHDCETGDSAEDEVLNTHCGASESAFFTRSLL